MSFVAHLYRYPVKGLSAEACERLDLTCAEGIAFDRTYAVALGSTTFDPAHPVPLPKTAFLMLMKHERLACLRTHLDRDSLQLTIESDAAPPLVAALDEAAGARRVEDYLSAVVGPEATQGRPRLVRADDHRFTDVSVVSPAMMRAVSIVNLASVRELERAMGVRLHHLRFRANVYLEGVPAWAELQWEGRSLRIGAATVRGAKVTRRCAATHVNPETAERDANVVAGLVEHFGHPNMGLYVEVAYDAPVAVDDAVELLPARDTGAE